MNDAIEDMELVEAANFTHTVKFAAHTVVASLRYLRELSRELRIPMDSLQPAHVVENMKRQDQKQREHQAEVRAIDACISPPTKAQQGARANALRRHASC
jgi:hypothetical protein